MIRLLICLTFLAAAGLPAAAQTHQHPAQPADDGQFNPNVVGDGRGGFLLSYVFREHGEANIFLRKSADGVSYSSPVRVNDRAGDAAVRNENPPKVAVGTKGEIYICWASEREKWKGNIRFSRSLDGGKTFSAAINLNSDAAAPPVGHAFQSLAIDRHGFIYAAWIDERNKTKETRGAEIWVARSMDSGRSFSSDWKAFGDVCECCRTNLQIDTRGRLLMTYRRVPAQGPMFRDVMLAVSSNGGKNFTSTVVSEDHWELNGCPVAGPGFAIDEAGNVAVVWLTGAGEKPGLYFAISTDGGRSFTSRQILDPAQKAAKHASIVPAGKGRFLVGWDDSGPARAVWGWLAVNTKSFTRTGNIDGGGYPIVAFNGTKGEVVAAIAQSKTIYFGPAQ